MIQNLDPFLGIPADSEIINEQQLDPCIVPDPLTVLIQIFLPVENDQFVQQVTIVYELTTVITSACFHTTGRQEIRLAGTGDSIDPDVLPVLSEMKFQDLINGGIIVDASVAGFQILGQSTFIDQAAEPQICFKPVVECFYVLRFQNLTDKLQSGIAAEFRAFRQF